MSSGPVGVAVVGAGVISAEYLRTLAAFPDVRVVAVADLDIARAEAAARAHGVPVAGDLATVLALPEVELVVNLTVPAAHVAVAREALRAGRHVYGEKPLALLPGEAEKLLAEAAERGLLVGCAPDTFLGAGLQSALRAVAAGHIGAPVAASTAVCGLGPERWHPDPAFFYQPGAGPLFDLGPYYLTALVALFGGVERVAASARRARAERVAGAGPAAGRVFPVDVPTHVSALLDFASGPTATSVFSWDAARPHLHFEVVGTEATLSVPDPNRFDGSLRLRPNGAADWAELPVAGRADGRGLGVVDLARSIRTGTAPRASGALALHVLETMTAVTDSARRGAFTGPPTPFVPPAPLPVAWDPTEATLG
ncbi:Gfo/Idh/MocA family oxidoreductase [Streptomyces sp. Q6]|uniref:Gfo/Idh/MocA family oxidoreductase n=1 Tax=Streptomyces citrinus TaxID=3118173 RepID=A0ACD5A625_9ACTN